MTLAVLRKDLVGLWATAVPFVVGAVFQAVLGLLMVDQLQVRGQAVIQPLFPIAGFLLLLVVPLLTMRSFAEEARTGTLDLLLAVPVRSRTLVVGKWAAAWLTAVLVLAPAVLFTVLLELWGNPDAGPAISGFIGLVLLAGAAAGVGTLASACTSSQPVAAMTSVFGLLVLWFAHVGDEAIGSRGLLPGLSLSERLRLFAGGGIDTGDVGFFCCLTAAALVLASTAIGSATAPVRRRLVVAALALLAIAVVGVGADSNRSLIDLTDEQALTLSAESRAVVAAVDRDVEITAFLRRNDPGRVAAVTLLDRYRRLNRHIDTEVVDPDEAPGDVARLGVDPTFGGVALQASEDIEIAPSTTEQDLTSALARLIRERELTVCTATGHGERDVRDTLTPAGFGTATARLEATGYTVVELDLLADPEVPSSCSAILLAGPTAPLGKAEPVLRRWLDGDGRMLVLADPAADVDLDGLLEDVGLGTELGLVFEGDPEAIVAGDEASPIVRRYASASPVVRRLPPTYFPGVQEVTVVDEPTTPGLTTSRLADTSDLSYLETEPRQPSFDPGVDRPGPITVAASADRSRVQGADIRRTRVVVVGDTDFASNGFIEEAGNAQLLRQAMAWLTESEDLAALSSNLPTDRPLRLTDGRIAYARFLSIAVVPGLFLVAGGFVWAVRRSR